MDIIGGNWGQYVNGEFLMSMMEAYAQIYT